jgi:Protein of unknown function (DUF3592)
MLTYIILRIRKWLRYDHFHLTPEMKAQMARSSGMMKVGSWVGVCLLAVGAFLYMREAVRDRYALRAPGKVVRYEPYAKRHVIPVVQYTLPDGRTYETNPGFYSSSFDYRNGDDVTVLYWETKPGDGIIEGINFGLAEILMSSGLLFAVACRFVSKAAMNETLARIQWCLLLKLP